ncbi:hypothetical protein L1887_34115 [Cichorium endivia]|nr:hypothetical protein L1887_34115 [Cichorium endivia]
MFLNFVIRSHFIIISFVVQKFIRMQNKSDPHSIIFHGKRIEHNEWRADEQDKAMEWVVRRKRLGKRRERLRVTNIQKTLAYIVYRIYNVTLTRKYHCAAIRMKNISNNNTSTNLDYAFMLFQVVQGEL